MSIGVLHFQDPTFLLNNYASPRTKCNFCSSTSVHLQGRRWNPRSSALKLVALASASSVSGSGAEYSEGLLDGFKRKQTKRRIAGIDQDELVDPELMADPDSCFSEFNGVKIHHKVYDAASSMDDSVKNNDTTFQEKIANIPMILLHGFGASVFSWNRAMKRLAAISGSKVLAFDRPAFGLTSRVAASLEPSSGKQDDAKPLNPYSMAFSVLATLYFISSLKAEKAILVGHSAGCLVAVNTYFEAPERVAALILVAPAIFAPPIPGNGKSRWGRDNDEEEEDERYSSNNVTLRDLILKFFTSISGIAKYIAESVRRLVVGMRKMVSSVSRRILSAILRSAIGVMLVRLVIDKFGVSAVKIAWHDPSQVSEHIIQGYTKPLRSRGWDRALVEFTAATLLDVPDTDSKPPFAERVRQISCPVMIITGDNDRIVPTWNAVKLAKAIPGSVLEVIKKCGHLPHEEKVEEFVSAVERFLLQTVYTVPSLEEQQLQQQQAAPP